MPGAPLRPPLSIRSQSCLPCVKPPGFLWGLLPIYLCALGQGGLPPRAVGGATAILDWLMTLAPGQFDAIVLGAGAAGLMCAAAAGQRGRRVVLLEHNAQPG